MNVHNSCQTWKNAPIDSVKDLNSPFRLDCLAINNFGTVGVYILEFKLSQFNHYMRFMGEDSPIWQPATHS